MMTMMITAYNYKNYDIRNIKTFIRQFEKATINFIKKIP